jgi:K+-sensing histidine kinase KdpD
VFVIPVIVAGVGLGLGPSLCAAVVGALAYNFFLTEPGYSLAVHDPSNIWAIGLLFVVGLIASGVAFTSRRRAMEAERLKKQATIVQRYSQDVAAADNIDAALSITSRLLSALFQASAEAMLVDNGKVSLSSEMVMLSRGKQTLKPRSRPWRAPSCAAGARRLPQSKDRRLRYQPACCRKRAIRPR